MRRVLLTAVFMAMLSPSLNAQAPHAGQNAPLQPGPNVNAAGGIADPHDPAALVKADLNLQRQNETVAAASTRNPDHILAAANDYRFVDFPEDQFFGGTQNFLSRLIARLFARPARHASLRAAAAVGAWTGVYRSCDRGRTWIGSAVPGGPLDFSDASNSSALKRLTELAEAQGGHAETTDPVLVAGPGGRMHLVVLGFVRFAGGAVGDSRMYYVSYTDRNNREGGSCFNYDFMREVDSAAAYAPTAPLNADGPFIDKPAVAVDKDGTLYVAYTVFSDTVKSRIVVARSSDGGATWKKTIPLLNAGFLRNHGATLAVDPLNGTVFLAWRMFFDNWPLMVVSRSFDHGRTFLPATPLSHFWPARGVDKIIDQLRAAKLQPYDQFTAGQNDPVDVRFRTATARSLAFPTLVAGVVNGRSKLFAAWTERADVTVGSPTFGQPSATGSPRIMFTMSDNGVTWTPRRAIDTAPRRENLVQAGVGAMLTRPSGPQLQPVLTMSGTTNGQLLLMYYESRDELDPATQSLSGLERVLDVRALRIDPQTGVPLAPSVQVSQYPVVTNSSPATLPETAPGFRMANRQNLTMYSGGFAPFFGDYAHLSPSRAFEFKGGSWTWTSEPGPSLAIWTDNRDVAFPLNADGQVDISRDWTKYTPITPTDLLATPPKDCTVVSSRNSNPYFTEIGGIIAGAPQTFKPLTIQRAFATYVENRTRDDRFFRLTIQDDQAHGIDGSFDQFDFGAGSNVRNVKIFGNSSHHRTVWVQARPQGPAASLSMLVQETTTLGGALKADGYVARVVLNPDPNNDALTTVPPTAPGFVGDTTITADSSELHNPQISTPQISTFRVSAPQISSPQISTPQISTPQISTPQISTPQISTPQISSPQISTPQISTAPPDEGNGTDVTYTVTNEGTTWTTYEALFNVPGVKDLIGSGNYQFQVLITRTSLVPAFVATANGCAAAAQTEVQVIANIPVPQISSPQISTISNPQISTPQISTPQIATFSLAPAGGVDGENSFTTAGSPARASSLAVVANDDSHSTVLRDEVKVTLRAIALRPRAAILASGGALFEPRRVVVRVESESTNVVRGIIDPDGTQPADVRLLTPTVSVTGGTFTFDGNPHPATGFAFGVDGVNDVLSPALTFSYVGTGATVYGPTTAAPSAVGTYSATGTFAGNLNYAAASNSAVITITAGGGVGIETTLVSAPPQNSLSRNASFTFRSSRGPSTFVCRLDFGAFAPCTSPITYSGLANGSHSFQAKAADLDPTPGFAWTINVVGDYEVLHYLGTTQLEPWNGGFPDAPLLEDIDGFFYGTTAGGGTVGTGTVFRIDRTGQFLRLHSFTASAQPTGTVTRATDGRFYITGRSGGPAGAGQIHRFDAGGNLTTLHSLDPFTEGSDPASGVIQGTDGFFYGSASGFYLSETTTGPLRDGSVFRMDADGNVTVLHVFNPAVDGRRPLKLIEGDQGTLYGTTSSGGPFNGGTVFRLTTAGEFTVLHAFDPSVEGTNPQGGLILASDGNLYGTTADFLSSGAGTIYKINKDGQFAVVHRLVSSEGAGPLGELVQGTDGSFYGTAITGGETGQGTLFRMDINGNVTVLHSFGGPGDGLFPLAGVIQGSDGALYGSAEKGPGPGNPESRGGVLFRFGLGVGVGTVNVTTAANAGPGSLRQAILDANATPGVREEIQFNIPGAGPHTITPIGGLPSLTDPVFINGASQPGYAGVPLVVLDGSASGQFRIGLPLVAGSSRVRGLSIVRFDGAGVGISTVAGLGIPGGGGNVLDGNYIGILPDGITAAPNGDGVVVFTPNNRIGGTIPDARNVISGNRQTAVRIQDPSATANLIQGNYIGVAADGTTAVPNHGIQGGIFVSGASNNTIGGDVTGAGNVISGNDQHAITIGGAAHGTSVHGNFIGTDRGGRIGVPNGGIGIDMVGLEVTHTSVGGAGVARNVISGNLVGIQIRTNANRNVVTNNYIGIDSTGTIAIPNSLGVSIVDGASGNIISGLSAETGNLISGNINTGVDLSENAAGNSISRNRIGTNATGDASVGNAVGIHVHGQGASGNFIGGSEPGFGNLISGNQNFGVQIDADAPSNTVAGNRIGTNVAGTSAVPNTLGGISISSAGNTIGGTTAGARNIVSGNTGSGIAIFGAAATGNVVQGNFVGTSITGTAPVPNLGIQSGIFIFEATDNTIGGTAPGAGNVVSGNAVHAVTICCGLGAARNMVQGNFIGTDPTGLVRVANAGIGLDIVGAKDSIIGGPGSARNIISGNGLGMQIRTGATGTRVENNYIGTNATGTAALGNGNGISINDATSSHTIGGSVAAGNLISGNNFAGVLLDNNTSLTQIVGNRIGTDVTGTSALGNGGAGVVVADSSGNSVQLNSIAFNGQAAVQVISGINNRLDGNNISSNGGLGIDLGAAGVTDNDEGDGDTGANNLQNFPVITSATDLGESTRVVGTLNSTPSTSFSLTFYGSVVCDASGHGQGFKALGGGNATTDASGNGTFDMFVASTTSAPFVTAVATDPLGNTSEFSACQAANEWAPFLAPGTAAEVTTTNPRSGNASLELVTAFGIPVLSNTPTKPFGTFGQLRTLSFDWAIDPASQGPLPPGLALRVYPRDDPRTFFLFWDVCNETQCPFIYPKGVWTTTSLIDRLSIQASGLGVEPPPASLADIPADAPISGIELRGSLSLGLPTFSYIDNVTIGFAGADARVFNFELANPAASRHRPVIDWPVPAAIGAGTPLSDAELNARSSTPGTFAYSPGFGFLFPADLNLLTADFAAADSSRFLPVSKRVALTVTGLRTVLPDDPSWFPYLPTDTAFAAVTDANPRSGTGSLELSKGAGPSSAYIRELTGFAFGAVGELTSLTVDWFIDPANESPLPPQVALRVYDFNDPRSFFLFWDTCSEAVPCTPHPTGAWQTTNLIGQLTIQADRNNTAPASLADIPPDAPIVGIHIRANDAFSRSWRGFADNLTIGFGEREPIIYNFEK